jgi:RNA-binding protein YhbY
VVQEAHNKVHVAKDQEEDSQEVAAALVRFTPSRLIPP